MHTGLTQGQQSAHCIYYYLASLIGEKMGRAQDIASALQGAAILCTVEIADMYARHVMRDLFVGLGSKAATFRLG